MNAPHFFNTRSNATTTGYLFLNGPDIFTTRNQHQINPKSRTTKTHKNSPRTAGSDHISDFTASFSAKDPYSVMSSLEKRNPWSPRNGGAPNTPARGISPCEGPKPTDAGSPRIWRVCCPRTRRRPPGPRRVAPPGSASRASATSGAAPPRPGSRGARRPQSPPTSLGLEEGGGRRCGGGGGVAATNERGYLSVFFFFCTL